MKPTKADREKAKEVCGGCTCDFEKGFGWDGKHLKTCLVERIAQALADQREEDANIAESEPELPGEPTMLMMEAFGYDIRETMRAVCSGTKKSIATKIRNGRP